MYHLKKGLLRTTNSAMDAFLVFCLLFQITEALDKLLAFRETYNDHWTLVCTAKDNGDALVWNTDSAWNGDTTFKTTYTQNGDQTYCSDLDNSCKWRKDKWNSTDWKENPMGLVLDSRWEDFREYNNSGWSDKYKYVDTLPKKGALAFSIRGTTDAHFLLCQTKSYDQSFCYWITIKQSKSMKTYLQVCPSGLTGSTWGWNRSPKCQSYGNNYISEEQLSPIEWKHYILTWDGNTGNITLYNDKKQLLTYVYSGSVKNLMEFNLFHKSPNLMHIRYHNYTYLYTRQESDILDSIWLNLQNNNLCLRISIGLCAKCRMNIALYTIGGYYYGETLMTVNGTAEVHGLPTWQHVNVNMTVLNSTIGDEVILRIKPIIDNNDNTEGFWAVRNFRTCPPPDAMKIGRITNDINSKSSKKKNSLPNFTCQRISYTRNEVVTAHTKSVLLETDDYDCPNGTLCSMSCKSFYKNFNENCQNIAICDTRGCTCHTGYRGDNCRKQCNDNKYGYMCNKTCGQCLDTECNYKTGLCPNNTCYNEDVYHIPPYCDIEIRAPPAPTIASVNETSVHASIVAQDEYKKTEVEYTFVIKNVQATVEHVHPYRTISQNTTTLDVTISELEPGTLYWVFCNLIIKNEDHVIHGSSAMFKTSCTVSTNFEIDTGVTNLTITDSIQETILYPCPYNLYNITIQNLDIQEIIYKQRLSEMPFKLGKLEPGTAYEVIISNEEDAKNMSTTIRTKDGISSPVENIDCTIHNNTNAYLKWNQPSKTNGKIKEYEVILNITTYYGCLNLKRSTRPSEFLRTRTNVTNITFCDLQPYIKYTAIIYAWNSNRGEAAFVNFSTEATKIPRSRFTNLRKEGVKLVWDHPEDCSTISGPINAARLVFVGVSEAINNYTHVVKQTSKNSFDIVRPDLYGKETYKVFVYPIRDYHKVHNISTYVDLEFDTPVKAPSRVRNLDIVEVDKRNNSILLRWQEPFPPNGKIDHYSVANCTYKKCTLYIKNVPKNHYCSFLSDYICATIKQDLKKTFNISVYATNENVITNGEYSSVSYNSSELVPDQPENVTARVNHNKTVTLSWLHPWKTRLPLKKFSIQANVINTTLRDYIYGKELYKNYFYSIRNYKPEYTMVLDLIPSTQYEIFVYSITIDENYGETNSVVFEAPASIAFKGNLSYRFQSETVICLNIPKITYETKNSKIYFVVKGENPCKEYVKLNQFLKSHVNVKPNENAWLAGSFPASDYLGNEFCVGDNASNSANCPLRTKDYYTVIVIVQANDNPTSDAVAVASIKFGDISRRHDEIWIIPVVILVILSVLTLCLCTRRIQMMPREIMAHKHVSILYKSKEVVPTTPNLSEDNHSLHESTTDIASLSNEVIPNDDEPLIPIKVKDFEDYVKNAVKTGLLKKQYEMFPRGLTKPCNYGKLPENITKNRYRNLMAYDETRVVLEKLQDDPFSDYINANYIKGYKMEKRYIATQGPKPNTIIDFWRMIWQENVLVICMLANVLEHGKVKCEQYWPDVGKKKKYGNVKVYNVKHDVFADYTFRILHVTYDGETRQVKHLHYTTWPDHGVPMYTHSAVTYLKKLLATQTGSGPMVVHCSAGVGRTGTIILCDICLRRAAAEGVVDVFSETQSIRNQRVNMVDNKQQYLFAHLILVECLLALPTSLPCDHDFSTTIKDMKTQSNIQFQRLKDMWQDEALRPTIDRTPLSECNIAKHRYPELISDKVTRIYLKQYPQHVEDSDYIATAYVDGLLTRNQYLASQLPLPSTFSDFWRMITEFNVELVVVLQPPDPNDPTCCPIVPTNEEFKPTPYMSVITKEIVKDEYYVSRILKLVDSSKKTESEQLVTILSSTKYEAGRNKDPPPVDALVKLWQATGRIARGDSPTVVLCHDGVTGCGLYLALSFLLERMAVERECDVCLAIRTVRRSRPDFIQSIEQMEYLYDAALTYAEYFKTYANFS